MMKNKMRYIIISLVVIATIFLVLCSPYNSLRVNLLIKGHVKEAFTAEIVESIDRENNENIKYYYFNKRPLDSQGAQLGDFRVVKKGIFYFSSYWGRG
ncbi:MAG: hypothetical protein ACRDA5_13220 [Clostridium sp.]